MKKTSFNYLIRSIYNFNSYNHQRSFSSNSDSKSFQNKLFDEEVKRQRNAIGRIEKIQVEYIGVPKNAKMIMNKSISTPFNCAQHINELIKTRSAVALINDKETWDMHRPLEDNCQIKFLNFHEGDPAQIANRAFWRTCSFILGAIASKSFKANYHVNLHSFPSPYIRSGSFVYDVSIPELENNDWLPNDAELRLISAEFVKFCNNSYPLERLVISEELALKMFSYNPIKKSQIPSISENHDGKIIIYRAGDHIDISRGPMISHTGLIGRVTISSVHKIDSNDGPLHRFQGVSLPRGIMLNHFAYGVLEKRAKELNQTRPLPPQAQPTTLEAESEVVN